MSRIKEIYKSLTIAERYEMLAGTNLVEDHHAVHIWRNDMSIISNETFETMLNINNYRKDIFSNAVRYYPLQEHIPQFEEMALSSEWYEFFDASLRCLNDEANEEGFQDNTMEYIIRNFSLYSEKTIVQYIKEMNLYAYIHDVAVKSLMQQLTRQLMEIANKCLVLELNLQRENGELVGENSEERFIYFVRTFRNVAKIEQFYNKYVVLARLLSTCSLYYIEYIKKMIHRIVQDQTELKKYFEIDSFIVQNITTGEGDTHQKGNTVSLLTFINGTKIIYKPKSMEIDIAYNNLLSWLNTHSQLLDNGQVKTLVYQEYGYQQFIEYKPCESWDQVANYYRRFGQLMAIVQLLNGTDIHMENLISYGEYPVVVDLETLIQQPMPMEHRLGKTMESVTNSLFHHVTRTLFLPTNGVKLADPIQVDLSALNGREQKMQQKVLQPVNAGTDQMKYDFADYEIKASNNIPFMKNEEVTIDYKNYKDTIIQGYRDVYNVFLEYKEELVHDNGVLKPFNGVRVRCLFRDTNTYANIIAHMQHPEMLTDMLDREKAIENMWAYPFSDKQLIQSEARDMLVNDIPIFFNSTDTPHILDSSYREISNFYRTDSYHYLRDTLYRLDTQELEKQVTIIKLHFGDFSSSQRLENEKLIQYKESIQELHEEPVDWLEEAKAIADQIIHQAIKDEKLSWIIPYNHSGELWSTIPIQQDLYNGSSGLYLFLLTLYRETEIKRYKEYADMLLEQYEINMSASPELGLSGYPGMLYAASIINEDGDHKFKLLKIINAHYEVIEKQKLNDQLETDYVNGISGFINVLIRLYSKRKDIKFLELAMKLANHLEKQLAVSEWRPGMAHGAMGYALTLHRLGEITQIEHYLQSSQSLLVFENKHYNELVNKLSWCNGIIGDGIARLNWEKTRGYPCEKDVIITEIYKRLLSSSLLDNDCICHGNMGIAEFLLEYSLHYDDEFSYHLAQRVGQHVVKLKGLNGRYKLMDASHFPDITLFTGMAGIGYQFLRLHNPSTIPSILNI